MAKPNPNLVSAMQAIRETVVQNNAVYGQYLQTIDENTNLSTWAEPILEYRGLQNDFISAIMNKIVYTAYGVRNFQNPLVKLEGYNMPLGYTIEEVHVNPAQGRQFNGEDFAGILRKYEADVKSQYHSVNYDRQYCVTISRKQLRTAFRDWTALDGFLEELTNSLYNGAYIDEFNYTKSLVTAAYEAGNVAVETITAPTDEATAKAFAKRARAIAASFKFPSTTYTGWHKTGQSKGREVLAWTRPEDIVFLVRADIMAELDVDVLAVAFNMDKTTLLGNIIEVDNFDVYNDDGTLHQSGANIFGIMADRSWFKINKQDEAMDVFYNVNNRTTNAYLNVTKIYSYSLFTNAVVFASEEAQPQATALSFGVADAEIAAGDHEGFDLTVTPAGAETEIVATVVSAPTDGSADDLTVTVTNHHVDIAAGTDAKAGAYVVTVTANSGDVQPTASVIINVTAS